MSSEEVPGQAQIILNVLGFLLDGRPFNPWKIPDLIDKPVEAYAPRPGASKAEENKATRELMAGRVGILAVIEIMVNDLGFLEVVQQLGQDDTVRITGRGREWLERNRVD